MREKDEQLKIIKLQASGNLFSPRPSPLHLMSPSKVFSFQCEGGATGGIEEEESNELESFETEQVRPSSTRSRKELMIVTEFEEPPEALVWETSPEEEFFRLSLLSIKMRMEDVEVEVSSKKLFALC